MKLQVFAISVLLGFSVANPVAAPSEYDAQDARRHDIETRGQSAEDWNGGDNWKDDRHSKPVSPPRHRPQDKCPKRWEAVPFVRNPKSQCWWADNVIGYFFDCPKFDTVPLYALVNYRTWDFLYTTNTWERDQAVRRFGYKNQGTAGYIFPNEWCGGVPMFRLYSWRSRQHFYTTSWSEKVKAMERGYSDEGITGYIFRH